MSKAKREELESVARFEGGAKVEAAKAPETPVEEPKVSQHNAWITRFSEVESELPRDDTHKTARIRIDQVIKALAYAGRRVAVAERKAAKQVGSAERRAESKEKKLARIEALKAQIAKLEN